MAKEEKKETILVTPEELVKMSLWERLSRIKAELSKREVKKSGHNKFSGYYYHELADFMPHITDLQATFGVDDTVDFIKNQDGFIDSVSITLTNVHRPEETKTTTIPYVEAEMLAKGGAPSTIDAIQRMGSTITYNRRYIYMLAYNITENDQVDASDASAREAKSYTRPAQNNAPTPRPTQKTPPRPVATAPTKEVERAEPETEQKAEKQAPVDAPPRPFSQAPSASTTPSTEPTKAQLDLIKKFVSDGKITEEVDLEKLTKKQATDLIQSSLKPTK